MRETIENIIVLILLGLMAVAGMGIAGIAIALAVIIDNFPIVLICATALIIVGWFV